MNSSGTFYDDYICLGRNLAARDTTSDPLAPTIPGINWMVPAIYLPLLLDGE